MDLGRPLDEKFRVWRGPESRSLFPEGRAVPVTVNTMEHHLKAIESAEELAASAGAWGFGVETAKRQERRYASYRALQTRTIVTIDDSRSMRDAPRGAYYYIAAIHFGHAYEVVAIGDQYEFNVGVKAQLAGFGGSVSDFRSQHNLRFESFGRGLEPRDGDAIFASTPEEIRSHYQATGEAVPILVEYRRIPGVVPPSRPEITWREEKVLEEWEGAIAEGHRWERDLEPGIYRVTMEGSNFGLTLAWAANKKCSSTGDGTKGEQLSFSALCNLRRPDHLTISNPTGMGLGPSEQAKIVIYAIE